MIYSVAVRSLSNSFCMPDGCERHEGIGQNKKKSLFPIGSEHHIRFTKKTTAMKATLANRERLPRKRKCPWVLSDLLKSRPLITTNSSCGPSGQHAVRCRRRYQDRTSQHNHYYSQTTNHPTLHTWDSAEYHRNVDTTQL